MVFDVYVCPLELDPEDNICFQSPTGNAETCPIRKIRDKTDKCLNVQVQGHFTVKHSKVTFEDRKKNMTVLGNSDADLKKYGFRPSIEYYRAKLIRKEKDVSPWDFEKKKQ